MLRTFRFSLAQVTVLLRSAAPRNTDCLEVWFVSHAETADRQQDHPNHATSLRYGSITSGDRRTVADEAESLNVIFAVSMFDTQSEQYFSGRGDRTNGSVARATK